MFNIYNNIIDAIYAVEWVKWYRLWSMVHTVCVIQINGLGSRAMTVVENYEERNVYCKSGTYNSGDAIDSRKYRNEFLLLQQFGSHFFITG